MNDEPAGDSSVTTARRAPTAARVVLALGLVLVAAALAVTALETSSPELPGPVEVAAGVDPGDPGDGGTARVEPLGPRVLAPDPPATDTSEPAPDPTTDGPPAPAPPTSGTTGGTTGTSVAAGPITLPAPEDLLEDPTAPLDPITSPTSTLLPPLLDPDEPLVVPLPGPDLTVPILPGIDPELGGLGDLLRPR